MSSKWVIGILALCLLNCQTSLRHFNTDSSTEEEMTQDDGDTTEDPVADPVEDDPVITDYADTVPDDGPYDVVVDPPIDSVPDDVPVDIVPDDVPIDDVAGDDVVVEDIPVERIEQCDNGIDDDGDGRIDCMDNECLLFPGCSGTCYPKSSLTCGSSVSGSNTDADATDRMDQNACVTWDSWTGSEVAYQLNLSERKNVSIALTGLTADLDLFLLANSTGRCDGADCLERSIEVDTNDELIELALEPGTSYILVDGYNDAVSTFSLSVTCSNPEICNNGIDDDGDTLADCADPGCDLSPDCIDYCSPASFVYCGTNVSGNTASSEATDVIDRYNCSFWEEDGPEYAYTFLSLAGGDVTFTISDLSTTGLDLFVLEDDGGHCNPMSCIAESATSDDSESVTVTTSAGVTYYIVVDGYFGDSGSYRLSVNCL